MLYYPMYVTFNKTTKEIYQPGDHCDLNCYRLLWTNNIIGSNVNENIMSTRKLNVGPTRANETFILSNLTCLEPLKGYPKYHTGFKKDQDI